MSNLLTVEEFAEIYRTTTTTVYRWLKQGKLSAVKIGREWRIDADAAQTEKPKKNSEMPPDSSVWEKLNTNEHLMLLAESREKVFEAEASFFRHALDNGKLMMKGCWWQDPDEVEEKMTGYGLDIKNMCRDGLMKIVDFNRLYRKYGISGPVECWRNEIYRNRRNSLWASGSPCVECCDNEKNLFTFEKELNEAIKEMPVIGICPYYTEEFADEGFSKLSSLVKQHSGIVFYDSHASVLMRP